MRFDAVWDHAHLNALAWTALMPLGQVADNELHKMHEEEALRTSALLIMAAEAELLAESKEAAARSQELWGAELRKLFQQSNPPNPKRKRRGALPRLAPVLKVLKDQPHQGVTTAIQAFEELLAVRDWFAHGRQDDWPKPPLVDVEATWSTIQTLFQALRYPVPMRPHVDAGFAWRTPRPGGEW